MEISFLFSKLLYQSFRKGIKLLILILLTWTHISPLINLFHVLFCYFTYLTFWFWLSSKICFSPTEISYIVTIISQISFFILLPILLGVFIHLCYLVFFSKQLLSILFSVLFQFFVKLSSLPRFHVFRFLTPCLYLFFLSLCFL